MVRFLFERIICSVTLPLLSFLPLLVERSFPLRRDLLSSRDWSSMDRRSISSVGWKRKEIWGQRFVGRLVTKREGQGRMSRPRGTYCQVRCPSQKEYHWITKRPNPTSRQRESSTLSHSGRSRQTENDYHDDWRSRTQEVRLLVSDLLNSTDARTAFLSGNSLWQGTDPHEKSKSVSVTLRFGMIAKET